MSHSAFGMVVDAAAGLASRIVRAHRRHRTNRMVSALPDIGYSRHRGSEFVIMPDDFR